MNIAVFAQLSACAPFRTLQRWWKMGLLATGRVRPQPMTVSWPKNPGSLVPHRECKREDSVETAYLKPLRVVRIVESGQHRASVGRIVISGRMADVCAELDRLAACEAEFSSDAGATMSIPCS